MMETQQWPAKFQQSGAGTDTTQDSLNNGEDGNVAKEENGDGVHESDKRAENDSPTISEKARQLISLILEQMKELSNAEKYLLYLKLFQISNVVDPLRQPLNPLGSRSEINRTISWIKTHLEEDAALSLPKQEVYEEYTVYCTQNQIKSLSQADFGKVMKQVYPKVRARRLGTRGNSRYCYSGLRRCIKLKPPKLPDLGDKPLSTEATCTQSTLTAAAWLIVKEWSEFHFGVQFPSLQALARFLVVSHSVGAGTDAANQLTSATESQLKGEVCGGKTGTKHREMQLQLQKKIQQKNEVKERKRKIQSPKSDPKPSVKKSKGSVSSIRLEGSPTLTGAGESSTSTSTGSTSTSPTQGKSICDKSLDFTQLPALPDFKSFQKPVCEQQQPQQQQQNGVGTSTKVAIPRLASGKAQQQQRSPQSSPKKQVKNAKYKAIQPKPQPCDNASYNPQTTADIRSQGVLHNVDRCKERKSSDDDCDAPVFPLPRERLESISNVDKDAMDEYLGTNNSQHEEELSKYFSNNIETADQDNSTKLSQLRQLLEQNGISDNKNFLIDSGPTVALPHPMLDPLAVPNVNIYPIPAQLSTLPTNQSSARRRVSFETPLHEDTVPPSPNTRRKNFSFTPISPGPQSPTGRQSKCSSTNVSPFVSPRNTPIPRTKNTTHQNAGIGVRKKIKRESDLSVEIPDAKNYMAMSAPVSPMLYNNKKSVLEKLLHSNSKVAYTPDYVNPSVKHDVSEVDLLESENVETFPDFTAYRSQSVPLNQMIKSNFTEDAHFLPTLPNQGADFNDFDPISESVTVNRIIDALDEHPCENPGTMEMYNVEMPQNSQCLPSFNLIVDNNIDNFGENMAFAPGSRHLARSQSIDVNCFDMKSANLNPSRSVPSTPLPFNSSKPAPVKNFANQSSRSYPSTPSLVAESAFNYAVNGDCLLNGQPIRNGTARNQADELTYFMNLNETNEDNNIDRHLTAEEEFSIGRSLPGNEFGIAESENALMDEDGVLIGEQTFNGNINN
ncbi:uncharacterized protein LOC100141810 isoform X1 [Tribolium castaneum]|uniref:uncharacterized protein LOC100141810 isoform X1 n=1 Tax=Tribolium castaneum TaxID=7070 RepID=UPI0030FF0B08